MKNFKIPDTNYEEIEKIIGSDESMVGIDAKKTHIIIIHMLQQIQHNLDQLDSRISELEKKKEL